MLASYLSKNSNRSNLMFARCLKKIFLFGICCANLHAGTEQYFKKAEGKSGPHQMRNIDFIYMINLDQRPEKFEQSLRELAPYGIHPYCFSAVNGWELTYDALNDLGVKFQRGMRATKGTSYFPEDNGLPRHYWVLP
jgi:hypothetical protein